MSLCAGPFEANAATRRVLTEDALAFVSDLHRSIAARRTSLLAARDAFQASLDAGGALDFSPETNAIRDSEWCVRPAPPDLEDRRVEITGPVERKMMINALNSGAKVFMADFEDANSPTWSNVVEGQSNLIDAVAGAISYESPDGKLYRLNPRPATLVVRPRGWHLVEKHVLVDGSPISASVFDFGLYIFHNARALLERGSGPYYYLPKLETSREAALWRDVFILAEEKLGLPHGTIRATILIETISAAFEMEAILFELREYASGLNAGRWDYIFSIIKKFRSRPGAVLPDRSQIAMTVPFMRAYTDLLVRTCHRRGAHAIGGMAAFIPSRRDLAVNELAFAKVREDKLREANDGFDGTWVAHPDLVDVAREAFDAALGTGHNQFHRRNDRADGDPSAALQDFEIRGGTITERGLRSNISVGVRYLTAWLSGIGAAGIDNLMEDVATAEISRAQVWQWVRYGKFSSEEVRSILNEEFGDPLYSPARELFEEVALSETFVDSRCPPTICYLEGVSST
jgi:malate synthase